MSISARRMAVAALLIVMPSVAVVPQALAAPVPAAGHGPHGHGGKSGQGGHGGQGKKGQGKKGKGKKGKGHGHGGARLAGFGGGLGDGGGGTQRTAGVNTANAPTISSPPYQLNTGKRNVNAPAGNSAVDFAGVQQVSSVSVFTDSLSGNCRGGIKNCSINQSLESNESRGDGIGH